MERILRHTVELDNSNIASLIALTTAKIFFLFLYSRNSSLMPSHRLHRLLIISVQEVDKRVLKSGQRLFARTGTSVLVKVIHAVTTVGTIGAASVVNLIEPKIEANVSLRSIDDASREERRQQKAAGHKA